MQTPAVHSYLQTVALEAARAALQNTQARAPSRPNPSRAFTYDEFKCVPLNSFRPHAVHMKHQFCRDVQRT